MPTIETPHFALPFRFQQQGTTRAVAVNEQDSDDDINQCVLAILAYEIGSREEVPDFGIPDLAFIMGGVDVAQLRQIIARWEPRAIADIIEDPSRLDQMVDLVRINIGGQSRA